MGAFGLHNGWHDELIPPDALVEATPTVSCFDFARRLRSGEPSILLPPPTEHGGLPGRPTRPPKSGQAIAVAWHENVGVVAWTCPVCTRRCYRLHWRDDQWQCRTCARLVYTSKSKHKTIPHYWRCLYLRRRLGVSPVLFSEIEARPLRASEWWRLLLELRRLEAGLIEHLRVDIGDVLERRYAKRR